MSKNDSRDVFEKALDDDHVLTGDQAVGLLIAGVLGGTIGGRALGKRLASKAKRKAEDAAIARANRDGTKGWGRGKDARLIEDRHTRMINAGIGGGALGGGGAVYASTLKRDKKRK